MIRNTLYDATVHYALTKKLIFEREDAVEAFTPRLLFTSRREYCLTNPHSNAKGRSKRLTASLRHLLWSSTHAPVCRAQRASGTAPARARGSGTTRRATCPTSSSWRAASRLRAPCREPLRCPGITRAKEIESIQLERECVSSGVRNTHRLF